MVLSSFHCAVSPGPVLGHGVRSWARYRCKRGADRSLVVVGLSLTVANGLVPLQRGRSEDKEYTERREA